MSATPSATAIERTIDAEGVPILVTEFPHPGASPVVLLHGIGSRGQSWWPVVDELADRFHLYQVDLRGHGGSGRPERGYLLEDYAADLDVILDGLGLAEPRILGHSLGALIALIWASHRPSRAAALVLEDPSLHVQPDILGAFDGWQQLAALSPAAAAAWYKQEYPDWSDEDCLRRAETITSVAPVSLAELRSQPNKRSPTARPTGWRCSPRSKVRRCLFMATRSWGACCCQGTPDGSWRRFRTAGPSTFPRPAIAFIVRHPSSSCPRSCPSSMAWLVSLSPHRSRR